MKEEQSMYSEDQEDFSEDELSYYMELRKRRSQDHRKRRKRVGLAFFTVLLLACMGGAFQFAWMRAGDPALETEETLAGTGDSSVKNEVSGDMQMDLGDIPEEDTKEAPEGVYEDEIVIPDEEESQITEEASLLAVSAETLERAEIFASQYNYDQALAVLKADPLFENDPSAQTRAEEIRQEKDSCQVWTPEQVTHVFYHTLIKDPSLAFDGDNREAGYNQYMTTIDEFNQITQSMYSKGYVMVSIYDLASIDENGNMVPGEILLPPGKIPFVLSQDDVCYYHYMDGDGMATKLVVDEEGKIRNTYTETDGSISVGDYDMVPLIDRFVEAHPDFSYRGAKGIIALTGYNGILGYRTDISYQTKPDDMDEAKRNWLASHPDFDLESEREEAKKIVEAMKAEGWLFSSHTWGHLNVGEVSLERLQADTERFQENVDPLIGGTDIIIFAFGTDLSDSGEYSGEKFEYLMGRGYRYYCNVDATEIFVQLTDRYLRMSRKNLDGYRMYYNPELLTDLFDPDEVFDSSRPTPVPPMG